MVALNMLTWSVSNSELTGMSGMVPVKHQRSHHSVLFLTHNLPLFFFFFKPGMVTLATKRK